MPAEVIRKAEGKQFPGNRYFDLSPSELVSILNAEKLTDFRWGEVEIVMVQATSFDHVTINNQTNDVRLRQDVCLAVVSASKRCLS